MQIDGQQRADHETTMVLIERDGGEFLLLRRTLKSARDTRGKWVFPGGHKEKEDRHGERESDIVVAIRTGARETRQEAGIDILQYPIEHVGTLENDTPKGRYRTHVFHVMLPPGTQVRVRLSKNQPIKEHDRYYWIRGDVLASHILGIHELLRDHSGRPRGRNDYTFVSWEIVERGLIPLRAGAHGHGAKARLGRVH